MSRVKYSKKLTLNYKIINIKDINVLSRELERICDDEDIKKSYEIRFTDDSKIASADNMIFSSNKFERNRARQILINFYSKKSGKSVSCNFINTAIAEFPLESTIEIEGYDETWFDSTCKKMQDLINEIENQSKISKYVKSPYIVTNFSFLEYLIFSFALKTISPVWLGNMPVSIFSIPMFIIFMAVNNKFIKQIRVAYPTIEFAFGPEYMNESRKKKEIFKLIYPIVFDAFVWVLGLII